LRETFGHDNEQHQAKQSKLHLLAIEANRTARHKAFFLARVTDNF